MKKMMMFLFATLLITQVYGAENMNAEFKDLDMEYQQLLQEENARFEAERVSAQVAQEKVVQLKEAIKTVQDRLDVAEVERKSRFFKDDFDALTRKYREYLGKLEQSLATNEGIVADFQRISAMREKQN